MRAHESLCDREAEARAAGRARPRFVVAPEELEHALRGERREPLPRVLDCNDDVVGVRLDDDGDRAVVGRVPDRVREQVQQDTLDLVRGDAHARRRAFKARLEPDVPRPSLCVERTHAAGDELVEGCVVELERKVAGVDARKLEEIFHEERERSQLVADRRQVLGRRGESVLECLQHRGQRRERRAEIVARPRHQLPARVEQLLDVARHLVERSGELAELTRAGLGGARAEIPAGETRRGPAQPLQRPQDPAREHERSDQRRQRGRNRDRDDLRAVVHPEHDPAGGEHDDQRQAERREHQRDELELQAQQEPDAAAHDRNR